MTRRQVFLPGTLLVCLWTLPVLAQDATVVANQATEAPAHVSVVDGTAMLERDGRSDTELLSMPLLAGDRLRTQAGRVEVLFADGSALHLDEHTTVDFQSDEVVRLLEGRLRLTVAGPARDLAYRIDAPAAWVQINSPGEYRVSLLRPDEVELAVLRGGAELVNEQGRSYVSAGERTYARAPAAPSPAYVFNSAAWDSFDRWSEARRDQRLGVSAQYLPEDVRQYAPAFDTYGSWQYQQAYGYVWYPRVQVGWRPYYHGRWVSLRPYGWTWVAGDPWGWPTHHYGRWGISGGAWFWIPGRAWAPAWVSWAYAPGYVSWCPLGWNNRPVLGFSTAYYGGRRYDPWYAWSVLPRTRFGAAYVNVSRYPTVRVDPRLHSSFVVNPRGPATGFAVNRSAVAIRTAGRPGGERAELGRGNDVARTRIANSPPASQDGERRFPAAARAPGTPIASGASERTAAPERAGIRPRDEMPGVSRSDGEQRRATLSTTPVIGDSPRARPRAEVTSGGGSGGGTFVRGPRNVAEPESRAVTEAPAGAVRAVPRVRPGSNESPAPSREFRTYPGAPRYQGGPEAPASSARPSAPEARDETPRSRAIVRGGDERSDAREPASRGGVERNTGSYAPRGYGGGVERQAPSAAPRSAPPAPSPQGDGGGRSRGGNGGERSGGGGSGGGSGSGRAADRRR
jgi:ferric-dicitrate binding protein FerR (iron transport regulator)